jgi:hypothetical protein
MNPLQHGPNQQVKKIGGVKVKHYFLVVNLFKLRKNVKHFLIVIRVTSML